MAVDVLLGLQWGDEGKGKIVDVLAPRYQVVARFQGGPNAGHTLEFDGFKHVLHQIPSGIFRQEVQNIIGNGVVLDPIIFKKEIDGLAHFNLDLRKNLEISKKASIILPTHRLLDAAYEKAKGDAKIGSTLKGIGPTYTDKISRQGLRVGDMISPSFPEKYQALVDRHKAILDVYKFEYDLAARVGEPVIFNDMNSGNPVLDAAYNGQTKIIRISGVSNVAQIVVGSNPPFPIGIFPFTIRFIYKPRFTGVLELVSEDDEVLAITSAGTVMRTPAAEVRRTGRDTMGVRLVNLTDETVVVSIARNAESEGGEVSEVVE